MDPEGLDRHLERLNRVRRERDQQRADMALERFRVACADPSVNTMPAIIEAVNAYCTLGEICGVMRQVFGEYKETVVV
jgi:methylmalonyl-CoA mutase N-terminal domain/subunit